MAPRNVSQLQQQFSQKSLELRQRYVHDYQVKINGFVETYGDWLVRTDAKMQGDTEIVDVGAGVRDAVGVVWQVVRQLCNVKTETAEVLRTAENAPRPEMLGEGAFSNMEMEMDRFLAKKSAIYHRSVLQLFSEAD